MIKKKSPFLIHLWVGNEFGYVQGLRPCLCGSETGNAAQRGTGMKNKYDKDQPRPLVFSHPSIDRKPLPHSSWATPGLSVKAWEIVCQCSSHLLYPSCIWVCKQLKCRWGTVISSGRPVGRLLAKFIEWFSHFVFSVDGHDRIILDIKCPIGHHPRADLWSQVRHPRLRMLCF